MTDGAFILKIDAEGAERLKARAEAAGQSLEDYALHALDVATDPPGVAEQSVAFGERSPTYWRELEAICDEADKTGGIPWEQVEARLLNFGKMR